MLRIRTQRYYVYVIWQIAKIPSLRTANGHDQKTNQGDYFDER